jgi:hypothetical protein
MSKRARRMLSVFIPLMVTVLACTCIPTNGGDTPQPPDPRDTPPPLPPPPSDILFEDDFSDPDSGWEVGDYDTGSVGYTSSAYFVISSEAEKVMWGIANRSFSNVVIEVDATQVSAGPDDDNAYGVVCREQQGTGEGYYLRISGDGYYSIVKFEGESVESLLDEDWIQSSAIQQGNATNHIRAICDGSTLVLFVNGERLATAEDSTFTSGDIALTATTFESESTEVHFDNLVVLEP